MARGKGEGSIRQREDGRWEGRITINGVRRSFYGDKRGEVVDAIKTAGQDLVETTEFTVEHYGRKWLEEYVKPRRKYNTYVSYKNAVEKNILPYLGARKLSSLLPMHADELMTRLREAGKSEHAQRYATIVLKMIVHQAKKAKVLRTDLLADFEVPPAKETHMGLWEEDHLAKFLDVAENEDLYAFFVLAASCGLRHGEMLALHWEDVDLDAGKLYVKATLVWKKEASGPVACFDPPKTKSSRRSVTLSKAAAKALRGLKALRLSQGLTANALVFCTRNGTPYIPNNVRKAFKRVVASAGVPKIRIHDLRHTCATILMKKNVHPKIVQALLGHANSGITLDTYTSYRDGMDAEAAVKMDEVFKLGEVK